MLRGRDHILKDIYVPKGTDRHLVGFSLVPRHLTPIVVKTNSLLKMGFGVLNHCGAFEKVTLNL